MFPSVPLDLVEGAINDRYAEILGELPWQRQNYQAMLQTTAPYNTGTVAVTQGSAAITLTGGTWLQAMNGLSFQTADPNTPSGSGSPYVFSYFSATTGTLDRPYEGATSAASGYAISQSIYLLPSDCRLLEDNAFAPLQRFTHQSLSLSDPYRIATGRPTAWASYQDDSSTPPLLQVELWPTPDTAVGIPYTYAGDAGALSATSAIVQVWIQPTALIEGAIAKLKRFLKDYTGATLAEAAAKTALQNMRTSEAQGMSPATMRLDRYYTAHRLKRTCR
jgi:hypothetical protein